MATNGILTRVPGDIIARASEQLPPPDASHQAEPECQVGIEVPDVGDVRITYRLNTYRHGKTQLWHWVAVHAELVDQGWLDV